MLTSLGVKVNFARAARTDAGVHAAGNVVTLKMITEIPGEGSMLDRINAELPPEIRVWDFVRLSFYPCTGKNHNDNSFSLQKMRVQNSFDARTYVCHCSHRAFPYG